MTTPKDDAATSGTTVCSCAVPLTFGSLFAGIGGIDLGFERAGLQCKWQVEIDAYAQKVLAKHWPNVRRHDDVRTWPQPDTEYVDIIAGGFPCQDISYAGKGAGLAGERSGLFYEVCRIVGDMGPRIVVLENVAALLTRGLDSVLGTLASLGYDAEWHCIPAAAVGAPHIRDRIFIVAYAKGDGRKQGKPHSGGSREGIGAWKEHRPGSGDRWWAVEPEVGRVAHGVSARVDRLRGLGNAVVPQVAEWIGRYIVAASKDVA
jgi:DNA (cytosine-5)-methyltransferase 1